MKYIGEIAALATSFFFAMTALIFTSTGRSVGSRVTNRMRLLLALIYLIVLKVILFREPLPFSAGSSRWLWLSLSGIIGLALGALVGAALGVSSSLLAIQYAEIGVASTLTSLTPVFMLPISVIVFREQLKWQARRHVPGYAGSGPFVPHLKRIDTVWYLLKKRVE